MVLGVLQWCSDVHWHAVGILAILIKQNADIPFSLAMAEMTVLVATVYRNFKTSLAPEMKNASPGVTSRFEVFHDVTLEEVKVSFIVRHFCKEQIIDCYLGT
jgi:hypothetical protein